MGRGHMPIGRRERAKQAKRERITTAARELFAEHGVSGVTTQQITHRADVANGTLYLYASTKAELLIMVQNEKFAAAIDVGLAAANATVGQGALEPVIALIRPVVECLREHTENGRTYLHELVFGDPITAIIHISTATLFLHRSDEAVLADIRDQIHATLTPHHRATSPLAPRANHRTPWKGGTS